MSHRLGLLADILTCVRIIWAFDFKSYQNWILDSHPYFFSFKNNSFSSNFRINLIANSLWLKSPFNWNCRNESISDFISENINHYIWWQEFKICSHHSGFPNNEYTHFKVIPDSFQLIIYSFVGPYRYEGSQQNCPSELQFLYLWVWLGVVKARRKSDIPRKHYSYMFAWKRWQLSWWVLKKSQIFKTIQYTWYFLIRWDRHRRRMGKVKWRRSASKHFAICKYIYKYHLIHKIWS